MPRPKPHDYEDTFKYADALERWCDQLEAVLGEIVDEYIDTFDASYEGPGGTDGHWDVTASVCSMTMDKAAKLTGRPV